MLPTHGLSVLIVDDDTARATHTAQLVRVLGSTPVIAASADAVARLLPSADLLIVDEEALDATGARISLEARALRHVHRCLVSRGNDLAERRGVADSMLVKPFTAVSLGDVLAAARRRRDALRPRAA